MKFQLFTFQGSLENFVRLNTEVLGRFFTFSRILASLVSLISYPQKGIFCNNNITFFPISLHYVFSNKFVLHSNKSKNLMFNFFLFFLDVFVNNVYKMIPLCEFATKMLKITFPVSLHHIIWKLFVSLKPGEFSKGYNLQNLDSFIIKVVFSIQWKRGKWQTMQWHRELPNMDGRCLFLPVMYCSAGSRLGNVRFY